MTCYQSSLHHSCICDSDKPFLLTSFLVLVRGRPQAQILLSLDVAECVYFQLVHSCQTAALCCSPARLDCFAPFIRLFLPSQKSLNQELPAAHFLLFMHSENAGRLAEEEGGKKRRKKKKME